MYRHQSFIHPPRVPRLFDNIHQDDSGIPKNLNILNEPYIDDSSHPPQTPGIRHAICDLSELFYQVVTHNCRSLDATEVANDLSIRERLYLKLESWSQSLPDFFTTEQNFTPQTCWLRSHANETALSILNPIKDADYKFPEQKFSVRQLSIRHCQDEIEIADRFMKRWGADALLARLQFITLSTLYQYLSDESTHALFTAACQLLRFNTTAYPVVVLFLQGIQALAWNLKQDIPPAARQYFQGLKTNDNAADLPTSFILPDVRDLQTLVVDDDDTATETGAEIAKLIARWSALTVDT